MEQQAEFIGPRRQTLLEALCAGLNKNEDETRQIVRDAGWDAERVRVELRVDGWVLRLRADAEVGFERRLDERCAAATTCAPSVFAGMRAAELYALVKHPRLRELAERYEPLEHGGRLLMGSTGIGKSSACAAVVRRLAEASIRARAKPTEPGMHTVEHMKRSAGPYVVWARAFDLANARLETRLGTGEADAISEAVKAGVLILDDLGWESRRAGGDDAVLEVIAERYDAGRVTLATTGLRMEQFIERYGEAVMRRIVETRGPGGKVLDLWPREAKP